MTQTSAGTVRFDDCELDLAARELRRGGEVVALEPRVFALLAYLLEQRHRAVDKNDIQDAVWTGMIVTETALTRAIMKARRAVGDSAERQAVSRTVHGHGYQFVARLDEQDTAGELAPVATTRLLRPATIGAALAAAVVALVIAVWPGGGAADAVRLAIMPVANQTDDEEYGWATLGLLGYASDLASQGAAVSVVDASDVIRYTEMHGLPDEGRAPADLEQLRDVYGASHLLLSRLEKTAGGLRLSYALYGGDGRIERGTMVGGEPAQLMRGMMRGVVAEFGARGVAKEITLISDDPFINEAYSRGLAMSLEGRCGEALQLFELVRSDSASVTVADYEWASCARILGRWQDAEAAFERILDETPAEPPSSLRALAAHGLGTVYIRTGRSDEARAILAQGLDEARQAGDRKRQGMILNNLAIDAKDRREHDEARDLLARATLAYTEAGAGILPGQIPAALANIDMAEGKLDQAGQHLEQALAAFRATGDRRNEAMMLNNFGYLRRLQGRIDEALPLHLESLDIRREIGDRVGQGRILGMLSILYENEGRYDDAKAAASEAYQIASAANDKLFMATALAQLAQAELSSGNVDAASQFYAESGELFDAISDHSRSAQVTIRLARIDVQSGDLDAAADKVNDVLAVTGREALHEPMIEAMELAGDIALQRQDPDAAMRAWRDTLDRIDETGFVVTRGRVIRKLANSILDQNDVAAAEPLIGLLIGEGDTADNLRVRARYAFASGDASRAIELMETLRADAAGQWTDDDATRLERYGAAARDATN